MIITEERAVKGSIFKYNYSDQGLPIRKLGTEEIYCDAYDLPDAGFLYEETEEAAAETEEEAQTMEAL